MNNCNIPTVSIQRKVLKCSRQQALIWVAAMRTSCERYWSPNAANTHAIPSTNLFPCDCACRLVIWERWCCGVRTRTRCSVCRASNSRIKNKIVFSHPNVAAINFLGECYAEPDMLKVYYIHICKEDHGMRRRNPRRRWQLLRPFLWCLPSGSGWERILE